MKKLKANHTSHSYSSQFHLLRERLFFHVLMFYTVSLKQHTFNLFAYKRSDFTLITALYDTPFRLDIHLTIIAF